MVRVGVVPYLNAVPLVARLEGQAACVTDVPSALGARLEKREVDAALLPVAEALRGVGAGFLGHHGITSDGAVASVLLFLRRPPARLRTVALDAASRSSAAMARWLVRQMSDEAVTFSVLDRPGADPATVDADAVMLIGDPAMEHAVTWPGPTLDLGAAWQERVGLPFVYARWTARPGLDAQARLRIARLLDDAARQGLVDREHHARAWAEARGRDPAAAARYVTQHVGYEIGEREEAGLARYAAILREAATDEEREVRRA